LIGSGIESHTSSPRSRRLTTCAIWQEETRDIRWNIRIIGFGHLTESVVCAYQFVASVYEASLGSTGTNYHKSFSAVQVYFYPHNNLYALFQKLGALLAIVNYELFLINVFCRISESTF